MKHKKLIPAVGAALLLPLLLCGHRTIPHSMGHIYPQTTKIIAVDRDIDQVKIMDATGHIYSFFGCDDWQEGDTCSVIFSDMNTPETVEDDHILKVQHSAFGTDKPDENAEEIYGADLLRLRDVAEQSNVEWREYLSIPAWEDAVKIRIEQYEEIIGKLERAFDNHAREIKIIW